MIADFACLFGMIAQETCVTRPVLSATCGDHIRNNAHTLDPDIAEARADGHASLLHGPEGLALFCRRSFRGRSWSRRLAAIPHSLPDARITSSSI